MSRGRYRWPIRIGVILIAGIALLVWALAERSHNRLALENRSGEPITTLKVSVAEQTHTFKDVRPGTEVAAPFPIKPGDLFTLKATFAGGAQTTVSGKAGEQTRFVALPGAQIIPRPSGRAAR